MQYLRFGTHTDMVHKLGVMNINISYPLGCIQSESEVEDRHILKSINKWVTKFNSRTTNAT